MGTKISYDYAGYDAKPQAPENGRGFEDDLTPDTRNSALSAETARNGQTFRAPLDVNVQRPAPGQVHRVPFAARVHQRRDWYDQGNPDEIEWENLYPQAEQPGREVSEKPTKIVGMSPAVVIRKR